MFSVISIAMIFHVIIEQNLYILRRKTNVEIFNLPETNEGPQYNTHYVFQYISRCALWSNINIAKTVQNNFDIYAVRL